ncbi:hypothetical protein F4861DRAFT_489125 [Xylaria intraflava]|nr:hypothetical protein F4861DRAFT_489125 [Xylaria intraflava]
MTFTSQSQSQSHRVVPVQPPAISSIHGMILKNGKYRCNLCNRVMRNKRNSISSHNANFHPKSLAKVSAHIRKKVHFLTYTCGMCGKGCFSRVAYREHRQSAHKPKGSSPMSMPQEVLDQEWDTPLRRLRCQATTNPYIWTFWHSVIHHGGDRETNNEVS